jgi:hypothetical protein
MLAAVLVTVIVHSVVLSVRDKSGGGGIGVRPCLVWYPANRIPQSTVAFDPALARGGVSLLEDRFSYVVSPQGPQGHFCSRSLRAREVVLTAAHCQGVALKVVLGRHNLNEYYNGGEVKVRWEMPHPEYDKALMDNDFTLVFLDLGQDGFAEDVVTVRLNSEASVPANNQDATVGWGDINTCSEYYQDISNVLMEVGLNVVPKDECSLTGDVNGGGRWFLLHWQLHLPCHHGDWPHGKGLVLILAGAVCLIWDFFLVHSYACGLYLCSTVTNYRPALKNKKLKKSLCYGYNKNSYCPILWKIVIQNRHHLPKM